MATTPNPTSPLLRPPKTRSVSISLNHGVSLSNSNPSSPSSCCNPLSNASASHASPRLRCRCRPLTFGTFSAEIAKKPSPPPATSTRVSTALGIAPWPATTNCVEFDREVGWRAEGMGASYFNSRDEYEEWRAQTVRWREVQGEEDGRRDVDVGVGGCGLWRDRRGRRKSSFRSIVRRGWGWVRRVI
ncbi:hypothetical protein K432DRAFT_408596 [Lepidopterella palustris CBS 459.81]|uniref:Uncharacterized protein n=1 Tax=Lepidopterella palustris CBS 459.81 TaxID=1314670 RepID=A0A8E2E237_9PEZI|nr:hypothetical protein K432DRAFT_408596 [Lepidopterella palustris CBS 459.81]